MPKKKIGFLIWLYRKCKKFPREIEEWLKFCNSPEGELFISCVACVTGAFVILPIAPLFGFVWFLLSFFGMLHGYYRIETGA